MTRDELTELRDLPSGLEDEAQNALTKARTMEMWPTGHETPAMMQARHEVGRALREAAEAYSAYAGLVRREIDMAGVR